MAKGKTDPEATPSPEDDKLAAFDERERAVMSGGPGQPTAPAGQPAAPKLVSVKYEGKEYQVPEDAAQAWQSREQDFSRKLSAHSEELGNLRTWKRQVETTIQPAKQAEPDINTLWFENPAKAQEIIEQRIYQKVTGEYQRDQATRQFFDGFYRANDDLRGDEWLVNAVFSESFGDIADMPISKAQEKLAELTRERILKLTRKAKVNEEPTRSRAAMVEPASGERTPRRVKEEEDEGPKSMADVIRERAKAKAAAGMRTVRGA